MTTTPETKPQTTPAPAPQPAGPRTFTHATLPEWGVGLEVQKQPKFSVLFFEKAGEKRFVVEKALETKTLVPVTLKPDQLSALQDRAAGRKRRASPKSSAEIYARPKPKKTAGPATPRFASFKDQVALFEKLFEGGFAGETFVKEERGTPGVEGKAGLKEAGTRAAKEQLSAQAFASESTEVLFKRAQTVLAQTGIAHPLEGPVPFNALAGDDQAKAIAGLKALLYGAGSYPERVAAFVGSLQLKEKDGKAKKVTWPMATLFGALFDPTQHVVVKPTAFAAQAVMVGVAVDKSAAVDAANYGKFLDVAKKTEAQLKEAGHQPRDLLDVYSFIYRTHAEKPAA